MTIGVDIRILGGKTKSGIEEYTEKLLAHLIPLDSTIKYKLFHSSLNKNLPKYDWFNHDNVEIKSFNIPNKFLFASSRFLGRPYTDKIVGGADVFFSPHLLNISLSPNCKRVTTIHDLSFIHFQDFFSWRKLLWHKFEMNPLKQTLFSDAIITVSESTKKDLEKLFDIDPPKISVIYSGIDSDISRPSEKDLADFKIQKKLPKNFILFLGKIEPRKNIVGLIRAFNKLKGASKFSDLHLVLVGAMGWLVKDIVKEVKVSPYSKNIIFTDYIKNEEKAYYYSLAKCFVYPSFFEGFGFPNIEAMRCGVPVVTSSNSSIPEVVKDSAILINPHSVDEITMAVSNVLTDTKLLKSYINKGIKTSENYKWRVSASKTLDLLCRTINVY